MNKDKLQELIEKWYSKIYDYGLQDSVRDEVIKDLEELRQSLQEQEETPKQEEEKEIQWWKDMVDNKNKEIERLNRLYWKDKQEEVVEKDKMCIKCHSIWKWDIWERNYVCPNCIPKIY